MYIMTLFLSETWDGKQTHFWHSRLPFRCVDAWEEGATRGARKGGIGQTKMGTGQTQKSFKSAFWGSHIEEGKNGATKTNAKNSPFTLIVHLDLPYCEFA